MAEKFKVSVVVTSNGTDTEDIILFTEEGDEAFILADSLKRIGQESLTMHRRLNHSKKKVV